MLPDSNEYYVTPQILKEELMCNREIEFTLNGCLYFAEPISNQANPRWYRIWDVGSHSCVFEGDPDSMFTFRFPDGTTLNDNFTCFNFLYVY